jgi:hypothetical protein
MAIRPYEGVLTDIRGVIDVAEQPVGNGDHTPLVRPDQIGKRAGVTVPRTPYQLNLS